MLDEAGKYVTWNYSRVACIYHPGICLDRQSGFHYMFNSKSKTWRCIDSKRFDIAPRAPSLKQIAKKGATHDHMQLSLFY